MITVLISGADDKYPLITSPQEQPFPWDTRVFIARDIANGMVSIIISVTHVILSLLLNTLQSYLHNEGILHRDLTSENCLLRKV